MGNSTATRSEILSTPFAAHIQKPELQAEIYLDDSAKKTGKQAVSCTKEPGARHIQLAK